jgi:hypothetical protein
MKIVVLSVPLLAALAIAATGQDANRHPDRIPLNFSGGYDTDPRDRGRPVVLIASALGVEPLVFRDAFSQVRPARPGQAPSGERTRRNKAVLLAALGRYGITNERLDEVSDYYRYNPGVGGRWRSRPAKGYAVVRQGAIKKIVITDPGAGYSSAPVVSVPGKGQIQAMVRLAFSADLDKNGGVTRVELVGHP